MKTVGSRAEVWHGTAKKTSGGLLKKDLKKNKRGRIVSKKMSNRAKKEKRLEKAGYKTKKGEFKKFTSKKKKGGENTHSILAPMSHNEFMRLEASTRDAALQADALFAKYKKAVMNKNIKKAREVYKQYRAFKNTFDHLRKQYQTESNRRKKGVIRTIRSDPNRANRLNNKQIRFLSNTINKNLKNSYQKTKVKSPLHVRELVAKSSLVPKKLKRTKNVKRGEVRNAKKVINKLKNRRGI